MKKKFVANNHHAPTRPRPAHLSRLTRSLFSRLWTEVHPKPARPISHPIPPLTPTPVPLAVKAQGPKLKARSPEPPRPAAVDYLSSLLCPCLALAFLATGCARALPLKGGIGNELLISGCIALAVSAWFLTRRHGQLRRMASTNTPPQPPGS